MRTLIFALTTLTTLAASPAAAQHVEDKLVYVSAADAEMNAAIAKGRETLPGFFQHFAKPAADENSFSVKFDLLPEPDKVEFIWAQVVSRSGGKTVMKLSNEPYDKRFVFDQELTVADADIIDWGYFKGGVMQGNYSTRVLLPKLEPAEADQIRKAYGW